MTPSAEPSISISPTASCLAQIQQQCLSEFPGQPCPYTSYSYTDLLANATAAASLISWMNTSAASCGAPPIFTEDAFGRALSLNVVDMDVDTFSLSLFLNAALYAVPGGAYLPAHQESVNGTAFLTLPRANLTSALALSEAVADDAMKWRYTKTSGCACVATEPWIAHRDFLEPGNTCVAQLQAACAVARAQGAECAFDGFFVASNGSLPLGAFSFEQGRVVAPIIVTLATQCPGGRPYLREPAMTAGTLATIAAAQYASPWQTPPAQTSAVIWLQGENYGLPQYLSQEPRFVQRARFKPATSWSRSRPAA